MTSYRLLFRVTLLSLSFLFSFTAIQGQAVLGPGQTMAMDNAGFTFPDIELPQSMDSVVNNNVQNNLGASNNLPPTPPDPVVNEMATPLQDSSFDNLSGPGENIGVDDNGVDTDPEIPAELESATDPAVQNSLVESQQQADADLAADAAADDSNSQEDPSADPATDDPANSEQTEQENQDLTLEDTEINLEDILQELSPN